MAKITDSMRGTTIKQRASFAANCLLSGNRDKLDSRRYDSCFENGDGCKVVGEIIKILAKHGITSHEKLSYESRRFSGPEWWTDEKYRGGAYMGTPLF